MCCTNLTSTERHLERSTKYKRFSTYNSILDLLMAFTPIHRNCIGKIHIQNGNSIGTILWSVSDTNNVVQRIMPQRILYGLQYSFGHLAHFLSCLEEPTLPGLSPSLDALPRRIPELRGNTGCIGAVDTRASSVPVGMPLCSLVLVRRSRSLDRGRGEVAGKQCSLMNQSAKNTNLLQKHIV